GAAHISGELIDLVEATVDGITARREVPQIAHDEIIGRCLGEARVLDIDAAHPEALTLQSLDKMAPDEPARTAHQRSLHHSLLRTTNRDNSALVPATAPIYLLGKIIERRPARLGI